MRKILLLLLCLYCFGHFVFGQNSTERYVSNVSHVSTNEERYKIDYELVNNSLVATDKSILENIELFRIEYARQELEDVIFFDKKSGLEILVYSKEKTTARKNGSTMIYQLENK